MTLPAHVHMTVARGREYFAYHPFRGTKRAGKRVALPGAPVLPDGSPDPTWWAAYRAAAGTVAPAARAGTFAALAEKWMVSPEWKATSKGTATNRLRHLRRISDAWGDLQVRALEPRHVLDLRDAWQDTPAEANNMLRTLSSMLSWSVPRGWRSDNPCSFVPLLGGSEPYAAWPDEAIAEARRLFVPEMWRAVALALYTGQRLGDVLTMTWRDVDAGTISVRQEKTGKRVWIRVHSDLAAVLRDAPRKSIRILTGASEKGRPWTKNGFQHQWQHQLDCAGVETGEFEGLVFHGLRKSAVVKLLEAGCTVAEVSAITGQSMKMVEHYAADVDQTRLASAAILKWERSKE